jgi:hypothetical protein
LIALISLLKSKPEFYTPVTRTIQTMKLVPSTAQILIAISWLIAVSRAIPVDDKTSVSLRSAPHGHIVLAPSTPFPPESLVPNESTIVYLHVNATTAEKIRKIIKAKDKVKRLYEASGHALGDIGGEILYIGIAILVGLF